ncbi:protein-lysine methyltransferase METTL21D-like [Thrips palmi]|uniref:Protein-lysine methyltransferase METTL21D-like n=1 Tax=Thrips palmi TaxID=161013 RepID=A0A6P9AMW7_THRPL|nr:protein-lysine methyltransferase METTL21D-like [Thrips palmi]
MTAVSDSDDSCLFAREFEVESLDTTLKFYQKEIGDVSCVIWDASLVLARYLEKRAEANPTFLKNLKIVELGAGVGCVGILAACFGADVTMTDLPSVLPLLERNICINKDVWCKSGGRVEACELSWGDAKTEIKPPSLLLLADCVYYSESILPLVQTMKEVSNTDTEIIICQEERDSDKQRKIWKEFTAELSKYFRFIAVPLEEQHPLFRSPDILLLRGSRLIN